MYSIILSGSDLLLADSADGSMSLPTTSQTSGIPVKGDKFHLCGEGCQAIAVALADGATLPDGLKFRGLRESCNLIPADQYRLAEKGAELLYWGHETRYCTRCGATLERVEEICKHCPDCGKEFFPQMSPAVLVLVRRGEEALLVHAANFRRPFYGLVAGFVETGESLEECVAREVMEETNLKIKNIRYFGSQTWPYPSQLMIGFIADYDGGEIRFADGELTSGGFFTRDNVPQIPSPPSLARTLIDFWLYN